jgi:hypothetical protein
MIFKQIAPVDDMAKVIEETFGIKLNISGGWGYDNKSAVKVHSLEIPIDQFLHTFASIRANIEMNLTQPEDQRYGGINVNFIDGQQFIIENRTYDYITFEISAMREKEYAQFIQEYKDNYGKNRDFDLNDHFKRREEATISIESSFWFEGLEDYYHQDDTDQTT